MTEERIKILEMIQDGKITAAEGMELLKALEEVPAQAAAGSEAVAATGLRCLRIRVTSGSNQKVNANIPLGLVKVAAKFAGMGLKLIPASAKAEMERKGVRLEEINFDELLQLIDQGLSDGKLIDIDTDEPGEGKTKVEIYVQ